jgi:hypothetical protein
MGLSKRSPDAIQEPVSALPRIASGLRRWLFQLCQSRAGQCLEQKTKSQQNL